MKFYITEYFGKSVKAFEFLFRSGNF